MSKDDSKSALELACEILGVSEKDLRRLKNIAAGSMSTDMVGSSGMSDEDWLDVAKDTIAESTQDIINQERHVSAGGLSPRDMSRKQLGNKAIMRELAALRRDTSESLKSANARIAKLEAELKIERSHRKAMALILQRVRNGTMHNTELGPWLQDKRLAEFAITTEPASVVLSEVMNYHADLLRHGYDDGNGRVRFNRDHAIALVCDAMNNPGGYYQTMNNSLLMDTLSEEIKNGIVRAEIQEDESVKLFWVGSAKDH